MVILIPKSLLKLPSTGKVLTGVDLPCICSRFISSISACPASSGDEAKGSRRDHTARAWMHSCSVTPQSSTNIYNLHTFCPNTFALHTNKRRLLAAEDSKKDRMLSLSSKKRKSDLKGVARCISAVTAQLENERKTTFRTLVRLAIF